MPGSFQTIENISRKYGTQRAIIPQYSTMRAQHHERTRIMDLEG
jgi:hypothetical protein